MGDLLQCCVSFSRGQSGAQEMVIKYILYVVL